MSRDPLEYKPLGKKRKPIDPRMFHKYLYAGGDPVNLVDPTGKGFGEYLRAVAVSLVLTIGMGAATGEGELEHVEVVWEYMEQELEKVAEEVAQSGPPSP
jgi:hypothetical protein